MSNDESMTPPRSLRARQVRLLLGVPVLAVALAALIVLTVLALQFLV